MTDAASGAKTPDQAPSYEQARDELTDVVRRLEAGGLSLEDSLALWERGEALAEICRQHLDGAQRRLAASQQDVDTES